MNVPRLTASCACGNVEIEAAGKPIATVICYCDDCQAAAQQIEELPGAASFCESDGGTAFIAYRRDRVRCIHGEPLLATLKLRDNSATNRKIATCCNSVMVLDFDDSKHWVDIYRARVKGSPPRPEMLVCTKFASDPLNNPDHMPASPGYSAQFMFRLLKARIAMLFSS
ncbi:GFA family protein [Methylovirgula sp. 4M-Z18]|uniref:GFA family protein n=1 Tax=Methylovirgula sp. 4M-Z18 TaxID=2293567 RepID=UPI0026CE7210